MQIIKLKCKTSDLSIERTRSRRACVIDGVQRNEAENNPEYSF